MMKAYSNRQKLKRDFAILAVGLAFVSLVFVLMIAGRDFDWSVIRLLTWIWGIPLLFSIAVLLSRKESVIIDIKRGVIISGNRDKESQMRRLCPLAVTVWSSVREIDGAVRYLPPRYQVVAKGWNSYVLFETASKKRAERKLAALSALFECIATEQ